MKCESKFTKKELLQSKTFGSDTAMAVLEENRTYTRAEAAEVIEQYRKTSRKKEG